MRKPRREAYASLRQRLERSGLPWSDELERCAIGAVLLAPQKHALRLSRRAFKDHFYCPTHSWIWDRITFALQFKNVNASAMPYWMGVDKWPQRYGRKFGTRLVFEVRDCLNAGYWWHGDFYIDEVIQLAQKRARIVRAAEELREAME